METFHFVSSFQFQTFRRHPFRIFRAIPNLKSHAWGHLCIFWYWICEEENTLRIFIIVVLHFVSFNVVHFFTSLYVIKWNGKEWKTKRRSCQPRDYILINLFIHSWHIEYKMTGIKYFILFSAKYSLNMKISTEFIIFTCTKYCMFINDLIMWPVAVCSLFCRSKFVIMIIKPKSKQALIIALMLE